MPESGLNRDPHLCELETYIRQAIRDAVYQGSRKPFTWGGLRGYQQLQAIAQAFANLSPDAPQQAYLRLLRSRVERALRTNQTVAEDLQQAHDLLRQVAACLHYPYDASSQSLDSQQVAQAVDHLLQTTQPSGRVQRAQKCLITALQKRWQSYGPQLLYCYQIPALPPDNLRLEGLFNRLRRHQRRISGRKSTRALLDFGQAQVLFTATSMQELLLQIQQVSPHTYRLHRAHLALAESPRQFLSRLHRDPHRTIRFLVDQHLARSQALPIGLTLFQVDQKLHTF